MDFEVGHIQTLFSIDENALALLCIIHLVLSYFSLLYRQTHLTTIQEEGILALFHTGSKYWYLINAIYNGIQFVFLKKFRNGDKGNLVRRGKKGRQGRGGEVGWGSGGGGGQMCGCMEGQVPVASTFRHPCGAVSLPPATTSCFLLNSSGLQIQCS